MPTKVRVVRVRHHRNNSRYGFSWSAAVGAPIVTGATASSVPAGVRASLRIEGGTAAVEFGCNRGGGPATTEGSAIAFGALASTKMACLDPGKAETEAAMQRFLTGLVPYAISATTLTLGAAGGDQLVFRAEE